MCVCLCLFLYVILDINLLPPLQLRGCEMTPTESSTRPSSQLSTTSTLRAAVARAPGGSGGRGSRGPGASGSRGGHTDSRGPGASGSRGGHTDSRGGEPVLLKSVYVEGTGWASQVASVYSTVFYCNTSVSA